MKNILKHPSFIIAIVFSLIILLAICSHKFYVLRKSESLTKENIKELSVLGTKAISSLDVPVASLLIFDDSIIGKGYNTVNADSNVAAHAEINAINMAIRKFGFKKFNELDRNRLKLITTYEPCAMCRSVMIAYNIRRVEFIKEKPSGHWLKEDLKVYRYELNKNKMKPEGLQDSLFHLHPSYNKIIN